MLPCFGRGSPVAEDPLVDQPGVCEARNGRTAWLNSRALTWVKACLLGADDQRWRLDPAELLGAVESKDRIDPAGGDLGRRKDRKVLRLGLAQALVVAGNPPARIEVKRIGLDIGAGSEPQQDVLAQPEQPPEIGVRLGPGRRQDDAGEPLRVLDRQDLGDRAAGRMADDMGALDFEGVHQPNHIGRHAVDGKAAARQIALPDAAMVVGDDVEILGEGSDLILPERGKPGQSRHEHDGKPDTLPLVIERAVANNDSRHRPASQNGTERRYHRRQRLSNGNDAALPCGRFRRGETRVRPCLKFDTQHPFNRIGNQTVEGRGRHYP